MSDVDLIKHSEGRFSVRRAARSNALVTIGGLVETNEMGNPNPSSPRLSVYDCYDVLYELWPSSPPDDLLFADRTSNEYDLWIELYQRAFANPARVPELSCPTSGAHRVELYFVVGAKGDQTGVAAFFCRMCMRGLVLSAPIPEWAIVRIRGEEDIPHYSTVLEGDGDE